MISKVTKSNKALYEARLAEIDRLLHEQGLISEDEVVDTLESYYQHIVEIQKLPVRYVDPDTGKAYESKYLLMPLDEPLFKIDANKRSITVPADFAKNGIGVKGDHKAEVLYFSIDRYFDARDLYDNTDYIIINWQFRGPNDSRNKELETHTSIALAPDDTYIPGQIVFGWVIEHDMTPSKGTLSFSIAFVSKKEDNTYSYAFNTLVSSVSVNDSLYLEDPSILSSLKRPVFERLRDSEYSPENVDPVKLPTWRTGQNVVWDIDGEEVAGLSGLPLIANFDYKNENNEVKEADSIILQAVGAVLDQEGVNLKYTWSGMKFSDGESVSREPEIVRPADGPSEEADWVISKDSVAQEGIIYWTGDGRAKSKLSISAGDSFPEGVTIYELGSSLSIEAAGDYLVEMQGSRMGATSRSVPSKHCIVPHAAIPEVTLKVAGVTPSEGNYEVESEDIASNYIFIADDENAGPAVKALITKDESNVRSRKDIVGVEVIAKKLEIAPNDINKVASQKNQDSIDIKQKDNNIIILGDLASLNSFSSTNPSQGEAKWIGIDLETNVQDITQLTWSGYQLEQADVDEAASVGLGAGHIIFWAKADQLPKIIKLGRAGYPDAEFKVMFMSPADFVEDEVIDEEKALENARKGIIKESELGKIAFIIAEDDAEPSIDDFADAQWEMYEDNKLFDIPNDNASAEGTYCVYAANERNHSYSISERSDLINVSRIAPSVKVEVIGSYNSVDTDLIIDNFAQGTGIHMVDGLYDCDLSISIAGIDNFIDPVETMVEAVEIFSNDSDSDADIQPNSYEALAIDADNYSLRIQESGRFVIRVTTFYHGTKRITETEPFVVTWDK